MFSVWDIDALYPMLISWLGFFQEKKGLVLSATTEVYICILLAKSYVIK
jgi:hypothetical protein